MPGPYADYQFRLAVLSPVATDSPFDSDTLWGRLICALMTGTRAEQDLGKDWLGELQALRPQSPGDWQPPLLVSEGFPCDDHGTPWLPMPLAAKLKLEQGVVPKMRKVAKKIQSVPLDVFSRSCQSDVPLDELIALQARCPSVKPALYSHLAMNRASNTGREGMLFVTAAHTHSALPQAYEDRVATRPANICKPAPGEIVFLLRLRDRESLNLIESALRSICREGWGSAKSRGLGRLEFKSLEMWQAPVFAAQPNAFVSLSSFCPAAHDPTDGCWKLEVKNPVPAQFVDGHRVALGEEETWRVKSFLRLRVGSCFSLRGGEPRDYYGRMLGNLLDPAEDGEGVRLPPLFHYALAFPVPMRWPED